MKISSKLALVVALGSLFISACSDVQVVKESDIYDSATRVTDTEARKQFLEAMNRNL